MDTRRCDAIRVESSRYHAASAVAKGRQRVAAALSYTNKVHHIYKSA